MERASLKNDDAAAGRRELGGDQASGHSRADDRDVEVSVQDSFPALGVRNGSIPLPLYWRTARGRFLNKAQHPELIDQSLMVRY